MMIDSGERMRDKKALNEAGAMLKHCPLIIHRIKWNLSAQT